MFAASDKPARDRLPASSTLSRSTWTYTCGTLGRNVVIMLAISGRLRAASINVFTFCARNATSFPARSSRTNVNPPAVPTPGIAGGGKCKSDAFAETSKFFGQVRFDRFVLLFRLFALAPGLERDKEKSAVGILHQTKQAKANDACRGTAPRAFY